MPGVLRPKYKVVKITEADKPVSQTMMSTDPENINSPFVIFQRKDPAAFHAMLLYSTLCEVGLGMEIRAFCEKIAKADPVYGTQGVRNWRMMQMTNIKRAME